VSLPPYAELVGAWNALRVPGLAVREVACVGVARTLLVAEIASKGGPGAPAVIITAGVHGDEPGGAWALFALVRDALLDRHFGYRLWPCTNPSGYERGTRVSAEGLDVNRSFGRGGFSPEARAMTVANRDRTFALNLDLHEDFEADGFYCYEPRIDDVEFGPAIVRAIDEAGLPIQELHDDYELGYPPEMRHIRRLERGRVIPDVAAEAAFMQGGLPHSIFLLRNSAKRSLTFESPSRLPWDDRLAMHRIAVVTALERLKAAQTPQTVADSET
jgi:murein peptide amidase A